MECPLCSAKAADGATECPSCGALFAKLKQRAEREKKEAQAALALAEAPPPSRSIPIWQLRVVASTIVILWIIGFALYFRRWMKQEPRPRKQFVPTENSVLRMRDPATGKFTEVPVHLAPKIVRPDAASSPSRPSNENGPPPGVPYDPAFDD